MTTWHADIELVCDDRARISLAKVGAEKNQRYRAHREDSGVITLTPMVSVPEEELLFWEDARVRASVLRGMVDMAEGRVEDLESVVGPR